MTATQPNIIGKPEMVLRTLTRQRDLGLIVAARTVAEYPDGTVEVAVTPAPTPPRVRPVGLLDRVRWWRLAGLAVVAAVAVTVVVLVGMWLAENWAVALGGLVTLALFCAVVARVAGLAGGRGCSGTHFKH